MQNTFSRTFRLNEETNKKFYFTPDKSGKELFYHVHINNDPEMKKFKMNKVDGGWKIGALPATKLPEWLFTLETQFDHSIEEAIAGQRHS